MIFLYKAQEELHRYKKNIAIEYLNRKISYLNFWRYCSGLSKKINKIKKNPRVIIISNQSPASYISIFGTLMAGGTYIPVADTNPIDRICKIISISKCNIILCSNKMKKNLKKKFQNKYFLDKDKLYKNKKPFLISKKKNKLAYIIFTSGSTGKPKGVCISRDSLDFYINWLKKNLKINFKSKCSQFPQIGFDLSVADIFGCISSNGTLVPVRNKLDIFFPGAFLKEKSLTHLICVPSLIDSFKKSGGLTKSNFKSLKIIFFCGEPLLFRHVHEIFKINKKILIINAYGPTEATCSCTYSLINKDNYKKKYKTSMSIGKANKGMEIKLLNDKNQISSRRGEILICGPQVSDGYLNQKDNLKKFFKKNKIKSFKTGDLAEIINKELYFVDRKDNQIKIRGHRVELNEIDYFVSKQTSINSSSIFINNKIITFIDKKLNFNNLKNILKKNIPEYMVPNNFYYVKKFPKNQNGKIDKKKLKDLSTKFMKNE